LVGCDVLGRPVLQTPIIKYAIREIKYLVLEFFYNIFVFVFEGHPVPHRPVAKKRNIPYRTSLATHCFSAMFFTKTNGTTLAVLYLRTFFSPQIGEESEK